MNVPANWFWIGLGCMLWSLGIYVKHRRAIRAWTPIVGEVAARLGSGNSVEHLIKYEFPIGHVRYHRELANASKPMARGDFVGLLVNPNDPNDAIIHDATKGLSIPLTIGIAGAAMAASSLLSDYAQ